MSGNAGRKGAPRNPCPHAGRYWTASIYSSFSVRPDCALSLSGRRSAAETGRLLPWAHRAIRQQRAIHLSL